MLRFIVVLTSIFFFEVLGVPLNQTICTSPECVNIASAILLNMNSTQKPCDDFYNFACGNFKFEHPFDLSLSKSNSWFEERYKILLREAQEFVTTPMDENEPKFIKEMKTFYRSCLNFKGMKEETLWKLFEIVGLPKNPFDDPIEEGKMTEILVRAEMYLQIDTFFKVTQEDNMIVLKPPFSSLKTDEYVDNTEKFSGLVKKVTETIKSSEKSVRESISQMITMKHSIKQLATASVNNTDLDGEIMSMEEFQKFLDNESKFNKSKIDVLSLTSTWVPQNSTFKVVGKSYFSSMSKYLDEHSIDEIGINIWMISFEALYPFFEEQVISNLVYQDRRKRIDFCSQQVIDIMDLSATYFMVDKIKEKDVEKLSKMAEKIRKKLLKNIEDAHWMEKDIKNIYKNYVESSKAEFGFPKIMRSVEEMNELYNVTSRNCMEGMENFKVDEDDYVSNLETLIAFKQNCIQRKVGHNGLKLVFNAHFFSDPLKIHILSGFIQFPWYFLGSETLDYGAIGFVIGHEFSHSLHPTHASLSGKTLENFYNISSCLIEQYSNYNLTGINEKIDGKQTLYDNIADNSGLKISYDAYKEHVKTSSKLPGLEKYTDDQLFFLSYANGWCEETRDFDEIDTHSPVEARIQVVLRNFKPFSDAWNCPTDSKMNPSKKCLIW